MDKKHTYKNHLQLDPVSLGNERRLELMSDILSGGTFLPKTVGYEDIDNAMTEWVDRELAIVDENGNAYPTFVLYSNQRFSEYAQTWQHVDKNNNLILSFKTVTRENNPQYGKIQSGLWNIPGDKFFPIRRVEALDDNGTESYLWLSMKQPTSIDLSYKVTVFTTKIKKINEFNTLVNKKFNACQCYIWPNNHPMPLKIESISDESQYNIDDRQFYAQTYTIKAMAYIITEEDYRVSEVPKKIGVNYTLLTKRRKADVEIEEGGEAGSDGKLILSFEKGISKASFTMDTDFSVRNVEYENIRRAWLTVNGERYQADMRRIDGLSFSDLDKVEVEVVKIYNNRPSEVVVKGVDRLA